MQIKNNVFTILFFAILHTVNVFAQTDSTYKGPATLNCSFVKYKVDHDASEIYFNILKVVNASKEVQSFELKYNIPENWKFVAQNIAQEPIVMQPGETRSFPLRLSSPQNASGGIAYVINAELIDKEGIPIAAPAYCYVNLPRKSEWKMKAPDRYIYVSDHEFYKPIKVHFQNLGNADENLKISLDLGRKLELVGFNAKNVEVGLLLPAFKDTILEFLVKYNSDFSDLPSLRDNKMSISAKGDDNNPAKIITFWFEKINSQFVNELKEESSPLVVWADLFNLLTDDGYITVQAGASGTIELPKKRTFKFYFWNGNVFNKNTNRDLGTNYYRFSRMYVSYTHKNLHVRLGDIFSGTWNVPFNGRGVSVNYTLKKHSLLAAVTRNIFNPIWTVGVQDSYQLYGGLTLHGSIGYRTDQVRKINSLIPTAGATYRYKKSIITGLFSPSIINLNGVNKFGYGHILSYSGNYFNRLRAYANNRYVARYFIDAMGMTNSTIGNVNYQLTQAQNITFQYNAITANPMGLDANLNLLDLGRRNNQAMSLMYARSFKKFSVNVGPGYQYYAYDNAQSLQPEFKSNNYIAFMGMNARGAKLKNSVAANITMAYTDVTQYINGQALRQTPYFSSSYVVNLRANKSGLIFGYYYGAPSYNFQRYYVNSGQGNKSFRINPYIQRSFLQNKLHVTANLSYWYQVNDKSNRTNLYTYAIYELGKGWSVNGNILFYYFTRVNGDQGKVSFSDMNMNFGARKTFDIPQPSKKYYDLKIIYFKDLNGNKVKDENEVGIPDILAYIENVKDSLNISSSDYFSQQLISDQFGSMECIRIIEGKYSISTSELMGTTEYVNQLGKSFEIYLGENLTVYVPFTKSNKVIGRVVVKRDEFSSLAYVSPGNIKITATDSLGNVFSALTNQDGTFILYAPQAGAYKIHVNNIFGEGFVLRQNDFMVDFNGLKEFTVTFIFEEKKRKINFQGDINGFDLASKNFELNGENGAQNPDLPLDQASSLPTPIDKTKIRFTIQIGAYNTSVESDVIDKIRYLPGLKESPTPQGLTRFTVGSYTSIKDAEKSKQEVIQSGRIPENQFVLIIGEYNGRFITAEEAQLLLND